MFELIIPPENFLSFNCLLWKEFFLKMSLSVQCGFFCAVPPYCVQWPCHQWASAGAQRWMG